MSCEMTGDREFILEKAEKESTEVAELVDRIVEMKMELVKLKEEKLCTSCYQYNEADSIYCSRCGKKLEIKENIHG